MNVVKLNDGTFQINTSADEVRVAFKSVVNLYQYLLDMYILLEFPQYIIDEMKELIEEEKLKEMYGGTTK